MMVRISVCIPVFNRKDKIEACVRSALAQQVSNLEVVVTDNHSDDGTWDILQSMHDERLHIFRNDSNIGMFGNFNRAAVLARGDYIVFLCSDDRLHPDFLAYALPQMDTHSNVVLLNGRGRYFNDAGSYTGWAGNLFAPGLYEGTSARPAFFWALGYYGVNFFNYPSGVVLRRAALNGAKTFREDLGNPADIDMYLRCLDQGDLMVSERTSCLIYADASQAGVKGKKAGQHLGELARLAEVQLDQPQYESLQHWFHHMLGAGVMRWTASQVLAGRIGKALSATEFGIGWGEMIAASFQRIRNLLLARIGIRPMRYLKRVG